MSEIAQDYLNTSLKILRTYKSLSERTFEQVSDESLFWQYNAESNSIAIIVKHMAGNMSSRWTDFLSSDGEKSWRNRDGEFEMDFSDRRALLEVWEDGWKHVFDALNTLTPVDLMRTVYIRGEAHSAMDAINRQIAHYASHVGQIIFIGKMCLGEGWVSLSIPRRKSDEFN